MNARVASLPMGTLVRLYAHPDAVLTPEGGGQAVPGDRIYKLHAAEHGGVRGVASDGAITELSPRTIVHVVLLAPFVPRYAMLGMRGRLDRIVTYAGRIYTPSANLLTELRELQAIMGEHLPMDLLDGLLVSDGLVPWCETRRVGSNEPWQTITLADAASALEGVSGPYEPGRTDALLFAGHVLTNGVLEYRGNRYRSRTSEPDDDRDPAGAGSSPDGEAASISPLN